MTTESVNFFWDILEQISLSEESKIVLHNILRIKNGANLSIIDWENEVEGEMAPRVIPREVKDWRLKSLQFHDFRSFPQYEDCPFGIDFLGSRNNPCSLFLLGSNGTGKSSIFTAIESYFTGRSSLAVERGVDPNRYLTFGFKEDDVFDIGKYLDVILADKKNIPTAGNISTPSSFCSLYDVQLLEQAKNGLTEFIFTQLGYGDVIRIDDFFLEEKNKYEDEIDRLNSPIEDSVLSSSEWHLVIQEYVSVVLENKVPDIDLNRKYQKEENIKNEPPLKWDSQYRLFADEWEEIGTELSNIHEDAGKKGNNDYAEVQAGLMSVEDVVIDPKNEKQIKRLAHLHKTFFIYYDDEDTIIKPYSVLDKLYEHYAVAKAQESQLQLPEVVSERREILSRKLKVITELMSQINMKKEDVVHEFMTDFQYFIKEILQYFSPKNEEFDLSIGENGICDVMIKVTPTGTEPFETSPREYFNSFRFVLYCVALKLALALNHMCKNKVSTPIVIDDVFDASDFENSLELEEFVYKIFVTYKKYVINKCGINIPLQIVLLTHDEMMKTAFERGMERLLYEDDSFVSHYVCGRLVPYRYAKECAEKKLINKIGNQSFYNLYIPL